MKQVKNIQTANWRMTAIKGCAFVSAPVVNITEKGRNDYADVGEYLCFTK
ncbi:MAG TPA: hypothetical protein PLD56_10390 [Chitinophagales bacterium]|nr:hypothetical protein [Chitinophagales bacterium]